jgi:hypothetical protein
VYEQRNNQKKNEKLIYRLSVHKNNKKGKSEREGGD